MTFIDWSDPEEMLGLLSEYVSDARNEAEADPTRAASLGALLHDLTELIHQSDAMALEEVVAELRRIHGSHARELSGDPVLHHVEACLEELERIRSESST